MKTFILLLAMTALTATATAATATKFTRATPLLSQGCVDDMACNSNQHCISNTCLPDATNCIAKGDGGNNQGLGGMGGCAYNEECCEGLQCTRTTNDFFTCE